MATIKITNRLRIIVLALLLTFSFVTAFFNHSLSGNALSGSDFKAGRIIDNSVFFNTNAINVDQIQQFLNSKVPSCDNNGTQSIYDSTYGDTVTRATYSARRGVSTPFTCLKDYTQTISAVINSGSDLCPGSISGGTKGAAQLIYEAATACGINPQVLIVLLQKEQSLISDDWPWPVQYQKATGYGCPDNAPCDSQYYGFFNQIYQAAQAFRRYEKNPDSYNYKANRNNYIYYHPSLGACGGSTVYIENQATANLYIYTPYQPNTAALNNLYGSGDSCSAYGNRNFWRMFNDWFGTTYSASYSWSLVSQTVNTDQTKTTPASTSNMTPGSKIFATVIIKNTGNQTWSNTGPNPIRLGTIRPYERQSIFCDSTWLSCSRPTTMIEPSVAPGSTATFSFWLKVPYSGIQTSEYFAPLVEGNSWMQDIGLQFNLTVFQPSFKWQLVDQQAYADNTKQQNKGLTNLEPNEMSYVEIKAKNTGNLTWYNSGDNPTNLGISQPNGRFSPFFDNTWLGQNRPTKMMEPSVAPGQIGTFEFWMKTPTNRSGVILEYFNLVTEGVAWHDDIGLNFYTSVKNLDFSWQLVSQYAYLEQQKNNLIGLNNLHPNQIVLIGFTARNTGNFTWKNSGPNPINVGTSNPRNRVSLFCNTTWTNCARPTTMKELSVAPGQIGTFEFLYKAPVTPGQYLEYFDLLSEGLGWMSSVGLNFSTIVVQ